MGNLAHLVKGISNVQTNLDEASDVKYNMDSMLEKRFGAINSNIEKSLNDMVSKSGMEQTTAFNSAVQQAMLQLTQTQQILMNSLAKISTAPDEAKKAICADIDKFAAKATNNFTKIGNKLSEVGNNITKAIGNIPEPPKTDLSALNKDIKAVGRAIESIPKAKFPDLSNQFKKIEKTVGDLEKRLNTRVHVFDIERGPDRLAKKITVRVK